MNYLHAQNFGYQDLYVFQIFRIWKMYVFQMIRVRGLPVSHPELRFVACVPSGPKRPMFRDL